MNMRWIFVLLLFLAAGCAGFSGPGEFRSPVLTSPLQHRPSLYDELGHPGFMWPVDELKLSRGFKSHGKAHYGVDLRGSRGSKIYAAAPGVVIYTGQGFSGYGRLVIIEHEGGWATFYSHLERIVARQGQHIQRGEVLGYMGDSGRATGVHLHFEVRRNKQPVDPLPLLERISTIAGSDAQ